VTFSSRSIANSLSVAGIVGAFLVAGAENALAANCGFDWAQPGKYKISASFRGKDESTNVFLGKDCRIIVQVPGVFTGGAVRKHGKCLAFSFKVEGEKGVFQAKWCDDYSLVPWQGKTIRATVEPLFRRSIDKKKTTNF
jgi:hypothetical protein